MTTVDADSNLLFGVLALQGELIDAGQFAEICTAWSVRKDRSIADLLGERGWISAEDRSLVQQLLERKLKKHLGDAHKSLLAAVSGNAAVLATLHGVGDEDLRRSLADASCHQGPTSALEYLSHISQPPETRDRYSLNSLHAKGGIGQVWLARDNALDREIALKELRPERSDDSTIIQRFLQEAQITGRLDHPGVVPVYELARGEGDRGGGRPYYTMRFVRGRTLSEAVADYHRRRGEGFAGRTELLALVQAFVGVSNTVAFAHSRGVIHRDLKGSNIILGEFGEVVLLDWGLAKYVDRGGAIDQIGPDFDPAATAPYSAPADWAGSGLTAAGQVMGTPAYMAPEQAEGRGDQIGCRTDVYGLGAILYEIIAGKPPFDGESIQEVLRKVREEPPASPRSHCPSAPKPLEAISLKAMAKDPGNRYATASELADDVQHWLVDEPVSAWREPFAIRARRWLAQHRTEVAAGVAALAVAVVGLAGALAFQARANRDLQAALDREAFAREDATNQSKQAEEAIDSLYRGITEDVILRRPELEQLRRRLLGTALRFYNDRVNYLSNETMPTSVTLRIRTLAPGLDRIASLQALLGDRDSAIRTRLRQVELLEQNSIPGEESRLQALLDLGNLQRIAGRPRDAAESIRKVLDQCKQAKLESKVALVQADLGRLLFDMGESVEARQLLDQAREAQERLLASSTPLPRRQGELAATYTTLGNLHEAEGRPTDALGFYEKAEAIYREIDAKGKSDYYSSELGRALNNVGLARAVEGKVADGQRDVERGKEIREQLLSDQSLNIERRADLARSYYHLARIHVLTGALDKAKESIRKSEELYASIPPKAPEDIYFRACMKALRTGLVEGDKPDGGSDRIMRKQLADQAMELLKQSVAAGYASPSRFKNDPPLDSLRSRPDFQDLFRSLGRPSN